MLSAIRDIVAEVHPNSVLRQRNEPVLIFMPRELADRRLNKNLITVWLENRQIRVMPDPPEQYDPTKLSQYRARIKRLLPELFRRNREVLR